jgi:hypothetical protein
MFGPWLIVNDPIIVRVLRALQEIFNEIDCIVQKVVVSFTNVDVQFALEF